MTVHHSCPETLLEFGVPKYIRKPENAQLAPLIAPHAPERI